ncbi:MAG: PQQ-binding-like beta-propeller repeat protein [Planctomycetota bacterium]
MRLLSVVAVLVLVGVSSCSEDTISLQIKSQNHEKSKFDHIAGQTASLETDSDAFKWPNIYGPEYNSVSREPILGLDFDQLSNLKRVWDAPAGKGYSAPVVQGGKIFMISRFDKREKIEARHAETGKPLWSYDYPTKYECSFEYSNGPYSTPVINHDKIIAVSAQGVFHCLNVDTGALLWRRDLLKEYQVELKEWPVTTSPIVYRNQIIFNLGAVERSAGIIALDIETGTTIWESTQEDFYHASPVIATIHNRELLFVMTDSGLFCLNPNNGKVYWNIDHRLRQEDRYNAVSPVVFDDMVCVVTGPSVKPGFRCLKVKEDGSFQEPWKNIRLLNSQYTNLVVVEGFLFGFTPVKQGGPELACIDIKKGELAWKAKPGVGRGSLLGVGKHLLILGEDGDLVIAELNGFRYQEVFKSAEPVLNKPCYTSMALCDGLLYARNEEQIVCLSLRKSDYGTVINP